MITVIIIVVVLLLLLLLKERVLQPFRQLLKVINWLMAVS